NTDKLVLGTVQFGINYGINNTTGQVPLDEVCRILEIASEAGIKTLDTSSAYGESERVLGEALKRSNKPFNIVSKYPKSDIGVRETFQKSLSLLGIDGLYGYLVHHFEFYQEHPELFDEMTALKQEGKIQKVGFSLYNTEQLQYLLDRKVKFDILQFPYNIFDKQFETYMPQLVEQGVEIHTRSAFLQGLFFRDTKTLPEKLKPLKKYLDYLHIYCQNRGLSVEQLALGYVLANPFVKGALIGVDNHEQLESNLKVASVELTKEDIEYIHNIDIIEDWLLNPVNWN
ncbi:MAG: aldo/keto reductase, partial [Aeriscardovia sp.]|nr:aldo/keto reductase [Aeriscardovia sp.]